MLKAGKLIDDNEEWIGGSTYVVQVGDQVDRCRPMGEYACDHPKGTDNDEGSDIKILQLFTKLHIEATKVGGKVISLLGNHEIMNVQGYLNYVSYEGLKQFENYTDPITGEVIKDGTKGRSHAFKPGNEYGKFLGCSRLATVVVGTNLFVHAGVLPILIEQLKVKGKHITDINYLVRKWLVNQITDDTVELIVSSSKYSMFWTRILGNIPTNVNIENDICAEYLKPVLETLKIGAMIIGHTPQSFAKFGGINGTCERTDDNQTMKTLWRVDNGSSKAFDKFDTQLVTENHINDSRKPQVLEILNDNQYNVIVYED